MSDYHIRFIGNVAQAKRPLNWPSKVYKDVMARVENLDGLREVTNQQYALFIRNQGMFVYLDPNKVDERMFVPDAQMFVPLHMLSSITTKTTKLASEIPGNEAIKQ